MPPDPVRPVYDGTGLSGIVPALLDWARSDRASGRTESSVLAGLLPEPLRETTAVLLLVLDGLGWDALQARRSLLPTLAGFAGGPITTVAPSTTAAALTSLTTGRAPSEHGLVGFRFRVEDAVLNALRWQVDRGRPPDPVLVQRHEPFRRRELPVLTKAEFRSTGFTEAHLRGARFVGWKLASELVEWVRRLVEQGERITYVYYPGIDEIAHRHGLHDGFYDAELAHADRLVDELLDALPTSCALLVTADHGQVHIGAEGWVPLGPFGRLVDSCAGDGRFRYVYARRGAAGELLAAARAEHGHHAWVLSRDELIDEGWLGPAPSATIRRRLGDVVIVPFEPIAIVDAALPNEPNLVGGHGSLTAAEMHVPLVAARGRR